MYVCSPEKPVCQSVSPRYLPRSPSSLYKKSCWFSPRHSLSRWMDEIIIINFSYPENMYILLFVTFILSKFSQKHGVVELNNNMKHAERDELLILLLLIPCKIYKKSALSWQIIRCWVHHGWSEFLLYGSRRRRNENGNKRLNS